MRSKAAACLKTGLLWGVCSMDIREGQQESSRDQAVRSEARQDLQDTWAEVSVRIGRAESDLRPDHLIDNHACAASVAAGILGFFVGSKTGAWLTGPVIIAALLSIALVKGSSSRRKITSLEEPEAQLSILSH